MATSTRPRWSKPIERCTAVSLMAEGEVGDVLVHQVLEQPAAFGLIRVNGHVDAPAVVKAHRAVYGGLAHGADRHGLAELSFEIQFHARERAHGEDAIAIVAVG